MIRTAFICLFLATLSAAQEVSLRRTLSGPSGHAAGATFVFDETRNRFVYPQDKAFIVYFEWAAPPGLHTITGIWKTPGGQLSISPEIKVNLTDGPLSAYWTFTIQPSDASGVWTLETRVDGAPGGAHSFELFVPASPKTETHRPHKPTTDELYRMAQGSLATVSSLDSGNERIDTSMGFVYGQDLVATSFESIDGATAISIRFSDGTEVRVDSLASWNRSSDWALIAVPTGNRKPLKLSASSAAKVGERALAFTLESQKDAVAAMVEISGRSGEPVRFNPALPAVSAGSPVLDGEGGVMGIVGAWNIPGYRIPKSVAALSPTVWSANDTVGAMTPIELVMSQGEKTGLQSLASSGILTPPMRAFASLTYATTTDVLGKRNELPDRNVSEFTRKNPNLGLVSLWERRGKTRSALIGVAVYDVMNRKRAEAQAKKISFGDGPTRVTQSVNLSSFEPGDYRVDMIADGNVVWRRVIRVAD